MAPWWNSSLTSLASDAICFLWEISLEFSDFLWEAVGVLAKTTSCPTVLHSRWLYQCHPPAVTCSVAVASDLSLCIPGKFPVFQREVSCSPFYFHEHFSFKINIPARLGKCAQNLKANLMGTTRWGKTAPEKWSAHYQSFWKQKSSWSLIPSVFVHHRWCL